MEETLQTKLNLIKSRNSLKELVLNAHEEKLPVGKQTLWPLSKHIHYVTHERRDTYLKIDLKVYG